MHDRPARATDVGSCVGDLKPSGGLLPVRAPASPRTGTGHPRGERPFPFSRRGLLCGGAQPRLVLGGLGRVLDGLLLEELVGRDAGDRETADREAAGECQVLDGRL